MGQPFHGQNRYGAGDVLLDRALADIEFFRNLSVTESLQTMHEEHLPGAHTDAIQRPHHLNKTLLGFENLIGPRPGGGFSVRARLPA